MASTSRYILYVDGASRGNPGAASIGASLQDDEGDEIGTVSEKIGHTTNNEAEYRALIEGLRLAIKKKCRSLEVRADSELMVRQIKGEYKVKNENLKIFWSQAQVLRKKFASFSIRHVRRELNKRADELANEALDASSDEE